MAAIILSSIAPRPITAKAIVGNEIPVTGIGTDVAVAVGLAVLSQEQSLSVEQEELRQYPL
jgi:hypothetical protein